jgi:hypothetical protein
MIGLNRRKSVMGNGRSSSARSSGSKLVRVGALGAAAVLLTAACVLLGSGSRHVPKSLAQAPASPIPNAFGQLSSPRASLRSKPDARAILGQLPMIFEPNQGQADPSVKFLARGAGYGLFLDPTGAVLAMQTARAAQRGQRTEFVRMKLVGANPAAAIAGSDPLPGKSNYFIGNDPNQWHTGIPQFARVHYQDVYPGIDLVFYGNQGRLEYDFKVAPGADPTQAELQFDGTTKLELSGGDLILAGTGGGVRLQAPQIYQRDGERRQPVEGRFVLRSANRVGFEIGAYDRARELVIDPTIFYSTYFGGSGSETSPSIAVNGDGNIYLAGSTTSTDLPISPSQSPYQSTLKGAQNIFILQLNPTLGAAGILYLTYLGGSGTDASVGLGVDAGGTAYVAGTTTSPNFPTVGGYQSAPEAGTGAPCFPNESAPCHVFVSALSGLDGTTGTAGVPPVLKYSTYLSGNGTDVAGGMTIDGDGDVFVTGTTTSSDVPSVSDVFPASFQPRPYQTTPNSALQFFVTEVNTKTIGVTSIPYSTYFGGSSGTVAIGGGIAVDTTGNIYFSGTTNFLNTGEQSQGVGQNPTDFPILNAYQPCLDTPPPTQITYPVACPTIASPAPTDAFVAKLNPANAQTGAAQLLFSTYLGGSLADSSTALTIDTGAANIYLTGSTDSPDFVIPTGSGVFQPCLNGPGLTTCPTTNTTNTDAYVARFSNPTEAGGTTATTVGLTYFSYLGGSGNDSGLAIAVDTASGALVTGTTNSTDFPASTGAIQTHLATNATQNAFFAHIDTTTVVGQNAVGSYATYFGGDGLDRGTSVTLDSSLDTYIAGDTTSDNLQTQAPLQPHLDGPANGPSDAFVLELHPVNGLCITCIPPTISPLGAVSVGNPVSVTFTITNQGPDLATNITVIGTSLAAFGNNSSVGSGTCSAPVSISGNSQVVCNIPTLQAGSTSTVSFVVTPSAATFYSVAAQVLNGNVTNSAISTSVSFTATDFVATISPSSQTVPAGLAATYSVLVSPSSVFSSNVSLTCSALPPGASCGFNPSTLTFNSSGDQSSTLTLTTTARPVTTITSTKRRGPVYALWLMAPGMALLGLGVGKRRRFRFLGLLALSAFFALVLLLPACSSKKTQPPVAGTPAGTYSLTVTATSGSFTSTAGFNLTVQ